MLANQGVQLATRWGLVEENLLVQVDLVVTLGDGVFRVQRLGFFNLRPYYLVLRVDISLLVLLADVVERARALLVEERE